MSEELIHKPPLLFSDGDNFTSWSNWLENTEKSLRDLAYRKYNQKLKNEDFTYWKTFYKDSIKAYQVGVLFYDFRPYSKEHNFGNRIGILFQCMIAGNESRIDMTVSKEITLKEVEEMAEKFYDSMCQFM
jgi:hypothetical protein